MQKKHIKGKMESADSYMGQSMAAHNASEVSVSDFWECSGTWCAMLLSKADHQVMPAFSPACLTHGVITRNR